MRRGHELAEFTQDAEAVIALVRDPSGDVRVRAAYLVGSTSRGLARAG
ncbi:hypothetical protein [Amycolatopsis sp. H20-H5]|nr:hypothetical protein [Amycolatopsis sp. H20-H5]MEC3978964.1 hypothetical protein [Amycolatopsis sp. H20-H5]